MKIGLNCFNINPKYLGGINTYTLGLIDGFSKVGKGQTFQLYVKSTNRHLFNDYENKNNFEIIEFPEISKFGYYLRGAALLTSSEKLYRYINKYLYKYVYSVQDENSDVIYTPTTILFPLEYKKPTVISMHDIQQFHFPEFFSKAELLNRKVHYNLSVELVDYIQASSNFIKSDLLLNYPSLKPAQIEVIPEGVVIDVFSSKKETELLKSKYDLPNEFLFFPAQLWHHKNHITVLKALSLLKTKFNKTIPLVLTGAKESAANLIFEYIEKNNIEVKYLGKVPFNDLLALYQLGKFMITAVLYESSSLPVLEAAASGTPIIASKTPPNIEMSKNLNINLFDPKNENELAELLNNIWDDSSLIKNQVKHNQENISFYSWDNAAKRYIQLFERIIKC